MNKTQITKENFELIIKYLNLQGKVPFDFIFACYQKAVEASASLEENFKIFGRFSLNYLSLTLYIANEHVFYLAAHPEMKEEDLIKREDYLNLIASVALDKYYTNEHLAFKNGSFASRYLPVVSTITLFLNFILGVLQRVAKSNPDKTLITDIMRKGFSMAKCITLLLTEGFETEAFSTWRTMHENECIVQVLVKYGKPVMDRYLVHLKYALAFRGAIPSKEETDNIFVDIKREMKEHDLKSKDMKRFIEYGWLLAIPDDQKPEDLRLNFRDGVEKAANLKEYSRVYEMSSEIAHSSPLLIYSRKNYFYLITLLNLYESFFRLEKIFSSLYFNNVDKMEAQRYLAMRKMYYGELLACYDLTRKEFTNLNKKTDQIKDSHTSA